MEEGKKGREKMRGKSSAAEAAAAGCNMEEAIDYLLR